MKRTLVKLFLIGLVILLAACSGIPKRNWPAQEGRLLDQDTEQPIEGALVVALWKGIGGHTSSMCFHVEVAETDTNGIYRIPAWRNAENTAHTNDQRVELVAYKAGYEPGERYEEGVKYLKEHVGGESERIKLLVKYSAWTGCGRSKEDKDRRYLIDRAIYKEALSLQLTEDDREDFILLLEMVERYELGNDIAKKRYLERLREIRKQE